MGECEECYIVLAPYDRHRLCLGHRNCSSDCEFCDDIPTGRRNKAAKAAAIIVARDRARALAIHKGSLPVKQGKHVPLTRASTEKKTMVSQPTTKKPSRSDRRVVSQT